MTLDPDAARVLEMVRAAGKPPFEELDPRAARAQYKDARRALSPEPLEVAEIREITIPGAAGPIAARLYRPAAIQAGETLPGLVFFHGGGWVIGDLDTHDVVCRHLADAGRCAVLSVDYRLAPEAKFPAAVEDACAATRWAAANAGSLGLDRRRLAVGGDSAGGNLAAVVCLALRDAEDVRLAAQLLLYPATDFDMSFPSQQRFAEGYLLTGKSQRWFRGHYLHGAEDRADWRTSPLKAPSLAGLPPAWLLTAGYDPLCDEGEAYARRLAQAGVPATHRRFAGQIHGFLTMGRIIRAAAVALDEAGRFLRDTLR